MAKFPDICGGAHWRLVLLAVVVLLFLLGLVLVAKHGEEKGRVPVGRIVNDLMGTRRVSGFLGWPTCMSFEKVLSPKEEFYPEAPYNRLPHYVYIEVTRPTGSHVEFAVYSGPHIREVVLLSSLSRANSVSDTETLPRTVQKLMRDQKMP